jgi:hypothetical protein
LNFRFEQGTAGSPAASINAADVMNLTRAGAVIVDHPVASAAIVQSSSTATSTTPGSDPVTSTSLNGLGPLPAMISDALSSGQLAYQVMIPGGISPSGHQWVPPVIYFYDPHLYSSFDDMMANAYNNSGQQSPTGPTGVGGTGGQ